MTTRKIPLAGLIIALSAFGCRPTNEPANDEHIDDSSHSVSPLGGASTHTTGAEHAQHGRVEPGCHREGVCDGIVLVMVIETVID